MTILLVGNHFTSFNHNKSLWSEFPPRLKEAGWQAITTSSKVQRIPRLLDMLLTIYNKRSAYQLAEIDVFSGPAFIWAECSARLLGLLHKPFILTLHGGNLPAFAERRPVRVRKVLQAARRVVAPSAYLQQAMRPYRDDIQVIPNPIDITRYPYRPRPAARPTLVWLRAFHEIYNPSLAPRVIKELAAEFPEIRLIMVGPDKGDGSLQIMLSLARELDVTHEIEVIGGIPRAQVPEMLGKADIFINTTNYDNTPVSVIEAMACGLCVVTTNVGGIPYLLEHEHDALLVPPDDAPAMAAAVRRILTEPGLAEKLSCNARKKAEGFDWSVVLPQWEHLFNSIRSYAVEREHVRLGA